MAEWEAEQKRLDREWYGMDEGYDDDHNPFSGMSEEYKKKKEEELEKKKKQRMTARQRQINRVRVIHVLQFDLTISCLSITEI